MNCREMAERVTDYLEGALSARGWLAVRWHLFRCDACVRYVAQMRRTIRLLADAPPPPAERESTDRVLAALDRLRRPPPAGD